MGILDDAIKEHLELKRQHGAGDSELKKIEDEAFGASERPGDEAPASDALAEAPTQFMAQPGLEEREGDESEAAAEGAAEPAPEDAAPSEAPARGRTEIADLQEPPVESTEEAVDSSEDAAESSDEPAEEQAPAIEHEAVSEPPAVDAPPPPEEVSTGPSTEERHAIAEQPTEMYDVEAELGDAEPAGAEPEVHALSEEDEEFWDEKRLSDELDQALEAPVELGEPRVEATPVPEPEPAPESADEGEESPPPKRAESEDVLEETPDFLEEAPEDDQLWFEQKPPKDFDFDD